VKTILIFTWFYLPFLGGAELFVKAITDRLAGRFRFVIITARADRRLAAAEEREHVRLLRTGVGYGIDKFVYPFAALGRALRLPSVDLVHAIMVNASAVAAYGFTRLRHRPTLLTLQEGDSEEYVKDYLGPFFPIYPRLHRPFDCIHAISSYLEKQAVAYGADPSSIRVVPNGVDTSVFTPGIPANDLKRKLDLEHKRVVISVSRLVPKNGLDTVIDAMPRVLERHPDVTLVLVGDGGERKLLEQRAETLSVSHAVRFVGAVEHERAVDYLRLADVFVRPSRSEGLGSAFLEAMACGVPVIGTPVGGIPDFLRDGENGLYVTPGSAASVTGAITRILSDSRLAKDLSASALGMVRANYRWDSVAERIAALYEALLNR
jgi:glycosyltransferase involved in cell wall biosynthesis